MEADDTKDVDESSSKLDFDGDDAVDLCCSVALAGVTDSGETLSVASSPLANERLIVAPVVKQQFCRIQSDRADAAAFVCRTDSVWPFHRKGTPRWTSALSAPWARSHFVIVVDRDTTCASLVRTQHALLFGHTIALKTRSVIVSVIDHRKGLDHPPIWYD